MNLHFAGICSSAVAIYTNPHGLRTLAGGRWEGGKVGGREWEGKGGQEGRGFARASDACTFNSLNEPESSSVGIWA